MSVEERLARIEEKLDANLTNLSDRQASHEEKSDEKYKDHEGRIRKLEFWKAAVPATVVVALVSGLTTAISALGGS